MGKKENFESSLSVQMFYHLVTLNSYFRPSRIFEIFYADSFENYDKIEKKKTSRIFIPLEQNKSSQLISIGFLRRLATQTEGKTRITSVLNFEGHLPFIGYIGGTIRDRRKVDETNFIEHENSYNKGPKIFFLFPVVDS